MATMFVSTLRPTLKRFAKHQSTGVKQTEINLFSKILHSSILFHSGIVSKSSSDLQAYLSLSPLVHRNIILQVSTFSIMRNFIFLLFYLIQAQQQPKIAVENGHMTFTATNGKDIRFKTGAGSKVLINGDDFSQVQSQLDKHEKDLSELKQNYCANSPCKNGAKFRDTFSRVF